jgi:hypothetical protein
MPTTKLKPTEFYVAVYSFAGADVSVAQGARFRGDHELVKRFPDRFVPESTPDDELHQLRAAAAAPPPPPEPLGRVKLRVVAGQRGTSLLDGGTQQQVFHGGRTYSSGETLVAEGQAAQHLLDVGAVELVKKLGPAKQAESEGGSGGFETGREAA